MRPVPRIPDGECGSGGRRRLAPLLAALVAVAVGLLVTFQTASSLQRSVQGQAQARFERLSERIERELTRRMSVFTFGLRGVRGIFIASQTVRREEFRDYFQSRDLESEFAGAVAMAYVARVRREDLPALLAKNRADGAPGFSVHPETTAPERYVTEFVEPSAQNASLLGFDLAADPLRRAAADRAMRSGEPTLSGKLQLPEGGGASGLLYLLPIYRHEAPLDSEDARVQACIGWTYFAIIPERTLQGIPELSGNEIDVEVFDGQVLSADSLLYDADEHRRQYQELGRADSGRELSFTYRSVLRIGDREWVFLQRSTPRFLAQIDRFAVTAVTVLGSLLSLLLGAVLWITLTGRRRAMLLAEHMTFDLKAAKESAEAALRDFRSLRGALDEHTIVTVTSLEGVLLDVNPAFVRLSGYSREELLGRSCLLVSSGHHPQSFWAELWRTVQGGRPWRGEVCNRRRDGSLYWEDRMVIPLIDSKGGLDRVLTISMDISERKAMEAKERSAQEAIAEQERLLRAVLDVLPQRVFWKDLDGQYLGCNRTFLSDCGLDDVVGRSDYQMPWRREEAEHYRACDRRVTDSGQAELDIVESLRDAKGESKWLLTNKVPLRGADGEVQGVLGTYQDITLTKQREAELARLRDAAEEASRSKSEFLANMSHEIRTPLTAILGYVDVLRDDPEIGGVKERRAEVLGTIRDAGQHLLTVINDILDLSKIEAGRMVVESIEADLPALLQGILSLVRPRAVGKGLELRLLMEGALPRHIVTDPTRLRQIVLNLLGNAVKFTEQGAVTLRVAGDDGALRVDVEDTGPGMSAEQTARLFLAFSQADTSVTRTHGGTGLGLTISRRLARLLGGDVVLTSSRVGEGSSFRLEMPLQLSPSCEWVTSLAERGPDPREDAGHGLRLSGRILLAEDGADNQRLIAFILRKAGAEVHIAGNGRLALEMLQSARCAARPFDLLLTDMQMPEMDGYTLARTLRERGERIPVVALTAHAMADDRRRCMEAGCDDYASKPVDRGVLIGVCARWLGGRPGPGASRAAAAPVPGSWQQP